jgi:acetoin utilization protein AcuB
MQISKIMSDQVVSALGDDSLSQAARLLRNNHIRHLPVRGAKGEVIGIVTDRDLKRASASDATLLETHELLYLLDRVKLSEVMTKSPVTVPPTMRIQAAAKLAADKNIGCLPVVNGGKLVGIVTSGDFLRLLAKQKIA